MEDDGPPNPGTLVKVFLPGESLWAEVLRAEGDRALVRLDNHPVCHDLHGYQYNDRLTVEQEAVGPDGTVWPRPIWKLAPLDRQLPLLGSV